MCARYLWSVFRRLGRDCSAASAVEFAMVAPLFLALLFGLWDVGRIQHRHSTVRFAMERASRSLRLDPTLSNTQIAGLVQSRLTGALDPTVDVSVSRQTSGGLTTAYLAGVYPEAFGAPIISITFTAKVETKTLLPAY